MKRQAILTLIKDIIVALVTYFLVTWLASGLEINLFLGYTDINAVVIGLAIAGIPFGYRWASKMFTAVSIKGFFIKLLIGLLLGWLAIFVVIIGDIIHCFTAPKTFTE
nr:hypothetical protein [Oscillospiraceae bacterium]